MQLTFTLILINLNQLLKCLLSIEISYFQHRSCEELHKPHQEYQKLKNECKNKY